MSLDFLSLRDYRQEEHSITHKREGNHALALQYWIAKKTTALDILQFFSIY